MTARRGQRTQPDDTLQDILQQLSPDDGWIVKIFRRAAGPGGSPTDKWLAEWQPDQVTEGALAHAFGPGKFVVRPWNEGLKKWGASKTVDIDAEAFGIPQPSAPVSGGSDNIQLEALRMELGLRQQQSDRMWELVLALIARPQQQIDLGSVVTAVKGLYEMGGGAAAAGPGLNGQLSTLRELVSFAKEFGGGSEPKGPWDAFFQLVPAMVQQAREPRALPEAGPRANPPANAAPEPPSTAETPPEEEQLRNEQTKFIAFLKDKAIRGKDPEFWADYIEENRDTELACQWIWYAVIDANASWEEVKAGLVGVDPEIKEHLAWFQRLYFSLKQTSGQEAETDEAGQHPARRVGDPADASDDGRNGPDAADRPDNPAA